MQNYVTLDDVIRNPDAWPAEQRLADLETWLYESNRDRAPRRVIVDWTLRSGELTSTPETVRQLREQLREGGFSFADGGQSVVLVKWAALREGEADAFFRTPARALLLQRTDRAGPRGAPPR